MQMGVVEPLFGTLSLWDASTGMKLTEDFSFHLNTESTLSTTIALSSKDVDPILASKTFGLCIDPSHRTSRIYLLLIVSKVLVGDLEDTLDVYGKGKDVKDKDRNKFVSENTELVRYLRNFRQQFAIATLPLFKDDGSLACGASSSYEFKIDGFTRLKSVDISDFLEDALKADKKEKERKSHLPGAFTFTLRPFASASAAAPIRNRVSPSLARVEPVDTTTEIMREVANFVAPAFGNCVSHLDGFPAASLTASYGPSAPVPSYHNCLSGYSNAAHYNAAARDYVSSNSDSSPPAIVAAAASLYPSHLQPASEPMNLVYFLPSRLNIEGLASSSSRNICMEVKILTADSNPDAAGQAWLHGDATYLSNATLVTAARSSVWYHNKKPKFLDEFKFNVPISVGEKHHILITLYHVNCKISSKEKEKSASAISGGALQLEEPIAYAAIPLLPRAASKEATGTNATPHKLIRNGVYSVPLVAKGSMSGKYLEQFDIWNAPLDANLWSDANSSSSQSSSKMPSGSSLLEFQIRVNSNVHSADPLVDEYLQTASGLQSRAMEGEAKALLEKFLARNASTSLIFQQYTESSTPASSGINKSGSGSHISSGSSSNQSGGASSAMSTYLTSVAAGSGLWIDKTEILRFLPLLMTTHMSLLTHESRAVRQLAFVALLQTLVDAVEANPAIAPSMIQSYVDLILDASIYANAGASMSTSMNNALGSSPTISGAGSSDSKLHVILLQLWGGLNTQLSQLRDVAMRYSWVLGSIVSKSAALQLAEDKRIPTGQTTNSASNENRSKWFPKLFYDTLSDFIGSAATATRHYHINAGLSTLVSHRFTVHLASFISDLYALADRGHLNKLVATYLDKMVNFVVDDHTQAGASQSGLASNNLIVSRCLFFKVLSQHPNFYRWNLPDTQDFSGGSEMIRKWQARHVLVTSLLDTFKMAFHPLSSEMSRDLVIDTILDLMYRLDSREDLMEEEAKIYPRKKKSSSDDSSGVNYISPRSPDFVSSTSKSKIAAMFLPYVYFLIDKFEYFESASVSTRERNKALLPLLWILKHCPYEVMSKYWARDSEKRIFALLKLCSYASTTFELPPEKLIRLKRDTAHPQNPIFSLTTDGTSSSSESHEHSGPSSRSGTANSAQIAAALNGGSISSASSSLNPSLFAGDYDPSGSTYGADPDAMGLLSSGMKGLQVPGAGNSGASKKKRRITDTGSTGAGAGGLLASSSGGTISAGTSGAGSLAVSGGGSVGSKDAYGGSIGATHGASLSGTITGAAIYNMRRRDKQELDVEVRREMNFVREVCLILVDTLVAFACTFPRALKRRDTFEQMWNPLVMVMSGKWTICATRCVFEAVYHLLPAFKVHFFAKQNSACPDLIYNTLKACMAPQLSVRSCALAVLTRIVQANFICTSNIDRFRLQTTIAIIKIVGSGGSGFATASSATSGSGVSGASSTAPQANISSGLKPAPGSSTHGAIPFATTKTSATDYTKLTASLARVSKELLQDDAKALLAPSTSAIGLNVGSGGSGKTTNGTTPRSPHSTGTMSPSELAPKKGLVVKSLEELQAKVQRILEDVRKMKQYEYDVETLIDVYYGMSRNLEDSPDERIVWLENVAELHRSHGNLEECAQAKILLASLVASYLRILKRWDLSQKIVPAFHLVAPNIRVGDDTATATMASPRSSDTNSKSISPRLASTSQQTTSSTTHSSNNPANVSKEYHEPLRSVKDEVCQSSIFSAKGFSALLSEAIQLLKEGGFYESCAAAYRMILPTYYENDNYTMQKQCYAELQWLCQQILDENVMKQRIFSNYYRVVVYGGSNTGLGGEVNGVEFVYKEQPTMRLMDFTEQLKRKYESKFGGAGSVVVLPNSQVVKASELDANKIFVQICTVDLYWTPAELLERNTGFKQQFGARRFVMEQPFVKPKVGASAKESAAQASASEDQHIRRTIFTTYESFPHLLKRSRVIHKEEVELSPIECAIALIEKRSRALKAELSSSSPNMKNIQRELQGAVLTQVNAGPLAVIQTFLADDKASKWNTSPSSPSSPNTSSSSSAPTPRIQTHREILADCVSEFERSVAFGLALNKAMIGETDVSSGNAATNEATTQQTLQEELAKGLDRLRAAMAACSIFASRKDAKNQMDEEARRQEAERAHRTLGDENGGIGTSSPGTLRTSTLNTPPRSTTVRSGSDVKISMIKKPESSPRAVSDAPIPAPLPAPIGSAEKDKKSSKSKDKEGKEKSKDKKDSSEDSSKLKEKRKLKKAVTEGVPANTHAVSGSPSSGNVPHIKLPPPIDSNPSPTLVQSAKSGTGSALASPSSPSPLGAPPTTPPGITPRARAISASMPKSTLTQADRDKEREEREKERLAELKAKAKITENTRVGSSADLGLPPSSSSTGKSPNASPRVEKNPAQVLAEIESSIADLASKASVIQLGIPEASEPQELTATVKTLKAFKETLAEVLDSFPSPPTPALNPSPAPSGDKLSHYKSVCSNEVENIRITLRAIARAAKGVSKADALFQISDGLQKTASAIV